MITIIPSVSVVSVVVLAVVTEVGVGVGSALPIVIMPSAKIEMESKKVKATDAKSLFSFFMVFPD
jgi:hypothetical protein